MELFQMLEIFKLCAKYRQHMLHSSSKSLSLSLLSIIRSLLYRLAQIIALNSTSANSQVKSSFIQTTFDTNAGGLQEQKHSVNKISKCSQSLKQPFHYLNG